MYTIPVGTHGIPNTTVASAPYNAYVDDVANDLNVPRPIVAGGTGASDAATARYNLGVMPNTGGTMTGGLVIQSTGNGLTLNKPSGAAGLENDILGQTNGVSRWEMQFGDGSAETGSDVGSNFTLYGFPDSGSSWLAMSVNRQTRLITLNQGTTINGVITANGTVNSNGNVNVLGSANLAVGGNITTGSGTAVWGFGNLKVLNSTGAYGEFSDGTRSLMIGADSASGFIGTFSNHPLVLKTNNTENFRIAGTTLTGRANVFAMQLTMRGNAISFKGNGTTGVVNALDFADSSFVQCGAITFDQAAHTTGYSTSSDIRGKPNRAKITGSEARAIIDALEVWDFDKDGNQIRGYGVIAQQAYQVHKSLATPPENENHWWTTEKAAPVPFLIAALQGANSRIDLLEQKLVKMGEEIEVLRARMAALEALR